MANNVPEDVQSEWLSVIRRLQSVAKSEGIQLINITIMVDKNGVPMCWTEPKPTKIEPRSAYSALLLMDAYNRK